MYLFFYLGIFVRGFLEQEGLLRGLCTASLRGAEGGIERVCGPIGSREWKSSGEFRVVWVFL